MPTPSADEPLSTYWAKRDFGLTSEPRGKQGKREDSSRALSFVIQKHAARQLHYDLRLELDGVLLSWAVPKGPSLDPSDKRMAIHVEDHPLSYGSFEGTIPAKQYGAGTVIIWDKGTWEPVGDPHAGLKNGKLVFRLFGQKLVGLWELVKIAKAGERQEPWILFKKRDEQARPRSQYDVVSALPDSVVAKPLTAAKPKRSRSAAADATNAPATAAPQRSATPRDHPAPPGAIPAELPDSVGPQLAMLATQAPQDGDWRYEIKFDGYRIMTRIEDGRARLISRGGHDWSDKMPELKAELDGMGLGTAWLDGEIVVLNASGAPDFNALQNAFDKSAGTSAIVYFVFDLPYLEGHDLRKAALSDRRQLLKSLLEERGQEHIRFSADFDADAASLLSSARRMGLEGLIAKRADARYSSGRTQTWLKLKCKRRQEFVVCGYTERTDAPAQVGSLVLGIHDADGKLVSAGSVGTGWSARSASELKLELARLEVPNPPFASGAAKSGRWSKRPAGSERWLKPRLVAEVEFAEWTPEGQVRHASFVGLRKDKPATSITRERAVAPAATPAPVRALRSRAAQPAPIKVTHAERVIDPSSGHTKLDLFRYYESVADWILPHLRGRPCSLVRGPSGVTGQLFFQKHGEKIGIPGIKELAADLWPGHDSLLEVGTTQALLAAAQMNVIEFHTWNSTTRTINKPDRMIFDLDPGEGTGWAHVQEAALLVRGLLGELGLQAWLKTSGGKGLHVVVPLAPKLDYETVKDFSQAVVQHLAGVIPSRFVAKSGPSNRRGKLFVDYLRNGHGATTASAFSARARPGLGVSMPLAWDDLSQIKGGAQWTIASARDYISFQVKDPWVDYWQTRQTLAAAMKKLNFKPKPPGR